MNKSSKSRADQLLVQQGLAPTRTRAQSLIMAGVVYAGTQRINKPSETFDDNILLTVKGQDHPFVSRGGVKLDAALTHFNINVTDSVCVDVGASTGGFTDCLLQRGAKKIYAIDVGYGQLAWKIRSNPKVIIKDRTNFRLMDISKITDPVQLIVIDASFISLKLLIPKALEVLTHSPINNQYLVALIKPQFEVGRENLGKGGIVKNDEARDESVNMILDFCQASGLNSMGVIPSPIKGQDGNQEFLIAASYQSIK